MRELAAWLLFLAGDAASRLLSAVPASWERVDGFVYRVYNRLMGWSVNIQGDGKGPWE